MVINQVDFLIELNAQYLCQQIVIIIVIFLHFNTNEK